MFYSTSLLISLFMSTFFQHLLALTTVTFRKWRENKENKQSYML